MGFWAGRSTILGSCVPVLGPPSPGGRRPFERKRESTERWLMSLHRACADAIRMGRAAGGCVLGGDGDREALAGPALGADSGAGPGARRVKKAGRPLPVPEGQGEGGHKGEPTQAPATCQLAGPCTSPLCACSCGTAASG